MRVFRPVVVFLTDGTPIDHEWQSELRLLEETRSSPIILTFGFGSADPAVLSRLASARGTAFFVRSGITPEAALADFARFIENATVTIESTIQTGAQAIQISSPDGWAALPWDE
jgi:uncharacterized protein YegL